MVVLAYEDLPERSLCSASPHGPRPSFQSGRDPYSRYRGAKGGYQLRRASSEIRLSEIIRLIDGPLAPFGDAEQLRDLIDSDVEHRALYKVFLDVRDAAAKILENTTLADIVDGRTSQSKKRKRKTDADVIPMSLIARGEK
jgi:hypothetical protein